MKVFVVVAVCLAAVAAGPEEDLYLQFNRRMPEAYYRSELIPRPPVTGRIVGGTDAEIEMFPYMLSLRRGGTHNCGASVLSDRWALSAAHCTYPLPPDLQFITLWGGSANREEGGILFEVDQIENHPQYDASTIAFDICALRTVQPLQGQNIAPIQLVPVDHYYAGGTRAVVSGWGLTSSPGTRAMILQKIDVPVIDQQSCSTRWPGWISDDMLCAGGEPGRSACTADSGGPLVVAGRQIGVVSWGSANCVGEFPGVYARVAFAPIRNWITSVTGV